MRLRPVLGPAAASVLAASLMVAGTTTAAAAPGSAAPRDDRAVTVQTVDATITSRVPTAQGFIASADVFSLSGEQIGNEVLSCVVPKPREVRCDYTVAFARGLVRGHFVSPAGSPKITGGIDGGTRHYAGARGSVAGHATEQGARVTLRIVLPRRAATTPPGRDDGSGRVAALRTVDATITSQVPTAQGFTASANVYNLQGKQVGTEVLSCFLPKPLDQCDFTVAFARGLVEGNFVSPAGSPKIVGVITGGTRHYAGAIGAVTGRATQQGAGARVTLLIELPRR